MAEVSWAVVEMLRAACDSYGCTLTREAEEHGWSEPHYTIGWATKRGRTCFIEITPDEAQRIYLMFNCWSTDGLLERSGQSVHADASSIDAAISALRARSELL
jgi:hypothetical protein